MAINDDGFYNNETYTVSCSEAMKFGKIFSENIDDIAIGTDGECSAVFYALCAGILSQGKNIWNCGKCTFAQLKYAVNTARLSGGIYIECSFKNIRLIPVSLSGLQLNQDEEHIITSKMDDNILDETLSGKIINSETIIGMYSSDIEHRYKKIKNDKNIFVNSSNPILKDFFYKLTGRKNTEFCSDTSFNISSDGLRASAYSCDSGFVFYEKLILIACIDEFEKGHDIPLPWDFPLIADKIAEKYNQKIIRYNPDSSSSENNIAKILSLDFPFLNDGSELVIKIYEIMFNKNLNLKELSDTVPDFSTAIKYIKAFENNDKKIKDICLEREDGRIISKPSKSGKSFMLYAESYSTETAYEMCRFWLSENNIK